MLRFLTDGERLSSKQWPKASIGFYREELLKHQRCLERQREYYSERAITSAETALTRLLAHLEQLCAQRDADRVLSQILRQLDVVTRLSAWSDSTHVH
jgi:hypothetical protein